MNVLFVCVQNAGRSQMAARVEQLLIELGEKEPVHDAS